MNPGFINIKADKDAVAEYLRFQTNGIMFGLDMQEANGISLKQHDIGKHLLQI